MEETKTDLGAVRIHNNVISAITSIAVSEVDGVGPRRVATSEGATSSVGAPSSLAQ